MIRSILQLSMIVICGLALVSAQSPDSDSSPKESPFSCGITLASSDSIVGTSAYVRLKFQLQALVKAQHGAHAMLLAAQDQKSASTPAIALSALLSGGRKAHEDLICAAYVVDHYQPMDENDKTSKQLLVIAYIQEAEAVSKLLAHIREQFLRGTVDQPASVQLRDAERIAEMNAEQQEAAETLIQTSTMSLMLAIDFTNKAATNTAQTTLLCREYVDLQESAATVTKGDKNAYADAAGLFVTFLKSHKCKG